MAGSYRFELFKTSDQKERSKIVLGKLKEQNGFFEKIKDTFKYSCKVNRILSTMRNSCVDYDQIEKTKPSYTEMQIINLFMLYRSPISKQSIQYDIECFDLCNYILASPNKKFSKEFISDMMDRTPTFDWECKIETALLTLNQEPESDEINMIKEFRTISLERIVHSPFYVIFINALDLREKLIKQLILYYIKAVHKLLEESNKKSEILEKKIKNINQVIQRGPSTQL